MAQSLIWDEQFSILQSKPRSLLIAKVQASLKHNTLVVDLTHILANYELGCCMETLLLEPREETRRSACTFSETFLVT
jgi:hypothetical protein